MNSLKREEVVELFLEEEKDRLLELYFERIGLEEESENAYRHLKRNRVGLEEISALMRSQLKNIPYENLDMHNGRIDQYNDLITCGGFGSIHSKEIEKKSMARIFFKLVTQKRGGFCFELNALFWWALQALGISTKMFPMALNSEMAGPVLRAKDPNQHFLPSDRDLSTPFTAYSLALSETATGRSLAAVSHTGILATINSKSYLIDVGLARSIAIEPVPLDVINHQQVVSWSGAVDEKGERKLSVYIEKDKFGHFSLWWLSPQQNFISAPFSNDGVFPRWVKIAKFSDLEWTSETFQESLNFVLHNRYMFKSRAFLVRTLNEFRIVLQTLKCLPANFGGLIPPTYTPPKDSKIVLSIFNYSSPSKQEFEFNTVEEIKECLMKHFCYRKEVLDSFQPAIEALYSNKNSQN